MKIMTMTYMLMGASTMMAMAVNAQTGVATGVKAHVAGGTGEMTRPTGVIDDTGVTGGTSSISTQRDADARMNTTGRGGTVSGRSNMNETTGSVGSIKVNVGSGGAHTGRLGAAAGVSTDVSSTRY